MADRLSKFAAQYAAALTQYLARQHEAILEQAYELGRKAASEGMGLLDVAKAHQEAISSLLLEAPTTQAGGKALRAAEAFLMETLSPFEATHRGFQETNLKLSELNVT